MPRPIYFPFITFFFFFTFVPTDSDGAICLVDPPHATTDLVIVSIGNTPKILSNGSLNILKQITHLVKSMRKLYLLPLQRGIQKGL